MPLAQSLPDLRRQLQEILAENLAAALNALKELLPEGSEKHRTALELRARFNDANKQNFRGVMTNEQLQLVYNQIRSAVFDLLDDLDEVDFEVKEKAASARASAAKQGSVLYRVPHRMPLRKPTICTVRVALDEEAILEDIVLDDEVRLRPRVEVSDMMKAELLDPEGEAFAIRSLSEAEQLVRDAGYTQWLFSVTPRVEGEHQLLVKVSMMEFNSNLRKYVPREVSILETVTIVTETAVSDSDEAPLKSTGEHFSLGHDVSPPRSRRLRRDRLLIIIPTDQNNRLIVSRLLRQEGYAPSPFFLIFILCGTTATWAFTPPPTRDWWVASWKDSAEAYQEYINKYSLLFTEGLLHDDVDRQKHEADKYLEKAYFYKADKTDALADLREYQRQYGEHGQFREQVSGKIKTLEISAVASIQQEPDAEKIRRFVQDFPESERLPELKQAVATHAELMPAVEDAYVYSIEAQPTRTKVLAYLRDFPQRERLPEVATAAAAKPEVLRAVQPELETAFLQKMEQNPDASQAEAFLKRFPVPTQRERFEQILDKKPVLKKQFLQKMDKAAAEQKLREEEERRRAAEEAAEKARLEELQRRAQEEKDAAERTRLEKEANEEAEHQRLEEKARLEELARRAQEEKDAAERARLEKEAAEEAERQRLKEEAQKRNVSASTVNEFDALKSFLSVYEYSGDIQDELYGEKWEKRYKAKFMTNIEEKSIRAEYPSFPCQADWIYQSSKKIAKGQFSFVFSEHLNPKTKVCEDNSYIEVTFNINNPENIKIRYFKKELGTIGRGTLKPIRR